MLIKPSSNDQFDRQGQILSVALDRFSQYGYERVTVKQIAEECEISEPAVYRYFESKEALFHAVLDSLVGAWNYEELFAVLQTEPDIERLLNKLALHILTAYCDNEKSCRLLLYSALREEPRASSIYQSIRGKYVQFLATQLNRLYAEGSIVKRNSTITARCFVGMVFECAMGFSLWKGLQGEVFPAEQVVANNVPIYARGLRQE